MEIRGMILEEDTIRKAVREYLHNYYHIEASQIDFEYSFELPGIQVKALVQGEAIDYDIKRQS